MKYEDQLLCQMGEIASQVIDAGEGEEFICFLRYCAVRLNKGDSVQAIWNDFQERVQ